jgi:hypothetical protein
LGHRLSVDADFFSNSPFNTQVAEEKLYQVLPGFSLLKMSPHGIAGFYHNVKIDLYTWHVPFLLPPIEEEGMRMAALPDIAALKLEAVVNRKEEKDFRDIHALLSVFSLVELLEFYHARVAGRDPGAEKNLTIIPPASRAAFSISSDLARGRGQSSRFPTARRVV